MLKKLIRIDDVGLKVEIPGNGFVRSPKTLLLDPIQLHRIMNGINAPKHVYCINSNDPTQKVRVTKENAALTEEELFPKEEVKEAPAAADDLTLDAVKPFEEVEVTEEVAVEDEKVEKVDVPVEEAPVVEEPAEEAAPVTEEVKEEAPKQYNNNGYNKNYKIKNKH